MLSPQLLTRALGWPLLRRRLLQLRCDMHLIAQRLGRRLDGYGGGCKCAAFQGVFLYLSEGCGFNGMPISCPCCLAQCDCVQKCKCDAMSQAAAASASSAAREMRERLAAAEARATDMVQRLQAVRTLTAQQLSFRLQQMAEDLAILSMELWSLQHWNVSVPGIV